MGAMMECRRRGLSVPEELALTGHGDFEFSEHLVPSLTTTRIDAFGIGVRAAHMLSRRIFEHETGDAERHVDVGFEVIERDSSRTSISP